MAVTLQGKRISSWTAFFTAICLATMANSNPANGQEATNVDRALEGSLIRVPQTTGLYFSSMNHAAVVESITGSNAWQAIKQCDVSRGMKTAYRRGQRKGYEDYNSENPFSQFLESYGQIDNPVVTFGWEIAKQVIENEIFLYVDNNAVETVNSLRAVQTGVVQTLSEQGFDELEDGPTEEVAEQLAALLEKNLAGIECPTFILGSRLTDPDSFRGMLQLARSGVEQTMQNLPADAAFLKEAWQVVDEENAYLLLANIDFSELPLDELLEQIDNEKLSEAAWQVLADKKATVCLGIVDNLLLFGVARDQQQFEKFGSSPRLIDLPQLATLRTAMENNETITSVSYVSQEFASISMNWEQVIEGQLPAIRMLIEANEEFTEAEKEDWIQSIDSNVKEFLQDIQSNQITPGTNYGYTTLHADGLHGYQWQSSKHPLLDGTKVSQLATHVGPETLAFFTQRPQNIIGQYGLVSKWSARSFQAVVPEVLKQVERERLETETPEEAAKSMNEINLVMDSVKTFFASVDRTTKEILLPAIDGEEAGFVLEMFAGPNSWHPEMPPAQQPLPIPLPALLVGTSDASAVIKAGEDYWTASEHLMSELKTRLPDEIPEDFQLIPPRRNEMAHGTDFRWSQPAEILELDSSLKIGTLVSKNWIVMNLHPEQAQTLTQPRAGNVFGPAASNEPSISHVFYDHQVMMKASRQWLDYAQTQVPPEELDQMLDLSQYEAERDTLQFTQPQLRDAFERVWSLGECMKGFSARSYEVDNGTVTQFLMKFEDIPAPIEK